MKTKQTYQKMKRNIFFNIAFLSFLFVGVVQPASGQGILKRLKEKVEETVEKKTIEKTEEKVEEAVEEGLDSLEDSMKAESAGDGDPTGPPGQAGQPRQRDMQNILQGMGMSGDPVPVEESYHFDHLVQMHVETYDKNGKKEDEGEFINHINPSAKNLAYEMISGDMEGPGKGLFIIDTQNKATIILGEEDGKKSGVIYGMENFFKSEDLRTAETGDLTKAPDASLTNPNLQKTGRTKKILGYTCEEYHYNDETTESKTWITNDLKLNTRDFFDALFNVGTTVRGIPGGYVMENTTIDKETGEKSTMKVTRVEENANTRFSLKDYELTNLGSFKMPEGTSAPGKSGNN